MKSSLTELQTRFPDAKFFINNELEGFRITQDDTVAEFYIQGGTLSNLTIQGIPVLWQSSRNLFKRGKAIRGGVPICWPWFGRPEHSDAVLIDQLGQFGLVEEAPQHGLVRSIDWQLEQVEIKASEIRVRFSIESKQWSSVYFPFQSKLEVEYVISDRLSIRLSTYNLDSRPFIISQALHSYFSAEDIEQCSIEGLQGKPFFDALDNWTIKQEQYPLVINQNIDRVYRTANDVTLRRAKDSLLIQSKHSGSTVVWNPWREKCEALMDCEPNGFREFICIETANATGDSIQIQPSDSFTLSVEVTPHNNLPRSAI